MAVRKYMSLKTATWLIAALLATPQIAEARRFAPPAPQLTRAPELVEFAAADYPEAERAAGREAAVVLRLHVDDTGAVKSAEVSESAGPAFDAAAVAAALKFRFTPAEIDGKPSAIKIAYRYEFELAPAAPTTAAFHGTIKRRGSGAPVAGVTVTVTSPGLAAPQVATTDAAGRFQFTDLPPGTATVTLAGERLPALEITEDLESGKEHDLAYEVSLVDPAPEAPSGDDLEIVVVAPPLRREVVSTAVRAEEAGKVPGTSGDVLRVVESLPGVARSAAGSGQLIVWGAAPQDTRVYVDGVPIPRLYHEGGLRSVIHPMLVDSIELVPGGYGAAFGRGLGGMVSVGTRTPDGKRVRGRLAADTLDASAVVSVALDKRERVRLAIAARVSYLKLWADRLLDPSARAFLPIPRYGDGQLRLSIKPSSRDRIEIVGLASGDRFARGIPSADPALAVLDERRLDFGRVYARWTRDYDDGGSLTVTPFVGYTRGRQISSYGDVATSLASTGYLVGVRANRRIRAARWLSFDVGLDAEVNITQLARRGSLGLPAREGDIRVFGQPPPDQIGGDDWQTTSIGLAPYAQAEMSFWTGKLRIIPGVRVDPYARSISRRNPPTSGAPAVGLFEQDFAVEPRFAIVGEPHWRVQLRGATGLYRQMPAAEDLSAVFGNPRLPTSRALHTVVGAAVKFTKTLSLDVTGFFTRSNRLAMRSPVDAPLPAQALAPNGSGRSYGAQFLLRQEMYKGLFGWVAYTIMRSERQNGPDAPVRLSDYDQTHILTAVLAYALPRGFEISGRFRYATGFPRTPVVGAYHDSTFDRFQPVFGAHNSTRIPAFVQLDLRLGKRFTIAKTHLDVFLELLNAWNRKNAEEIAYSPDFAARDYIRGFPVLPAFGLQWEF
ncbi:TonB family protein [Nannocystis sp. ncelm1]|uniref:TonB family protein n=2 Tax=Nannocystis radixulma TaxID=2995305 RepID=A0ABT5BER0_9BACT|nr:TonB family protein [Nannocystis radixulma]